MIRMVIFCRTLKSALISLWTLYFIDADFADGVAEREEVEAHQEIVDISIWLKKPDVLKWFACHEVTESNHKYPR